MPTRVPTSLTSPMRTMGDASSDTKTPEATLHAKVGVSGERREGAAGVPVEDGNDDEAAGVLGEGPGVGHDGGHDVRGRDDVQRACAEPVSHSAENACNSTEGRVLTIPVRKDASADTPNHRARICDGEHVERQVRGDSGSLRADVDVG